MTQIIEDFDITSTVKFDGPEWNDTIIRNVTIHDVDGDGIIIGDVSNLVIENCTIYNVSGSAIRLSNSKSTSNVSIINNIIYDIGKNGIVAGQTGDVEHSNLQITGNMINNTGIGVADFDGLYHGMYIQSTDALIDGNTITNSLNGNGISIRSSGVVTNNVLGSSAKSAIAYYSDHQSGSSDSLVIEHNDIQEWAQINQGRTAIDIISNGDSDNFVHDFSIQYNSIDEPANSEPLIFLDYVFYNFGFTINVQPNGGPEAGLPRGIILVGTSSADTLDGTAKPDIIAGRGGNDTLNGGDGNDLLFGNAGDDTLIDTEGEYNLFVGGAGNDIYKTAQGVSDVLVITQEIGVNLIDGSFEIGVDKIAIVLPGITGVDTPTLENAILNAFVVQGDYTGIEVGREVILQTGNPDLATAAGWVEHASEIFELYDDVQALTSAYNFDWFLY